MPDPLWLVLDAGNSAVKGGFFEGGALRNTFRLSATPDAWADELRTQLGKNRVARVGIASVVPDLTPELRLIAAHLTGAPVMIVHAGLRLPFAMGYRTPQTLGADRLASAAATWTRWGRPADAAPRPIVAIDLGTAVTYDVVDAEGTYRGGAIAPGPGLLRDALTRGTAQLPTVPLDLPATPLAASTREALQAGILFGCLDAVAGMLHRLTESLNATPFAVATGGWSTLAADQISAIDHTEPHLVLLGVQALLTLNP